MIQFEWTITFGMVIQTIIIVVSIITGWHALKARLTVFENTLNHHATLLITHSNRMDKHEERSIELVGDVQRLIGMINRRKEQ